MGSEHHLLLLIDSRQGLPGKEPVHAEQIRPEVFRLLYSPGLVLGIAAGDEFKLVGDEGAFEVTLRGGNLAVQVFSQSPVEQYRDELAKRVTSVGGRLDGSVDRGIVFTIPVSVGFATVESLFNPWVAAHTGWEWYYGNVYDPADGITPLGWWKKS
jgi:hypothetical protein